MKTIGKISYLIFLGLLACQNSPNSTDIETWKQEIIVTEQRFNDLAQKEGITKAFQAFAATDGVIKRRGQLIKGNEAIAEWYKNHNKPNSTLTWKPSFVDVSLSGDLGYTYGPFVFTTIDSTGAKKESTGTFHTVWKRQADGKWKFVWD